MDKTEMYKFNLFFAMTVAEDLREKYKELKEKASFDFLQKAHSAQLTHDQYACFCRVYISENIEILVRLNTINVQDRNYYRYFDFGKNKELDLKQYREQTLKLLEYILSEAIIMPYTVEARNGMTPSNATQKELTDDRWYDVWERRLLESHDYNDQVALKEWFKRCTNFQTEVERSIGTI